MLSVTRNQELNPESDDMLPGRRLPNFKATAFITRRTEY